MTKVVVVLCNSANAPKYKKLAKRYFSVLISRRCSLRNSTGTSAILAEVSLIFLSLQTGMVTDARTSGSKLLPLHRYPSTQSMNRYFFISCSSLVTQKWMTVYCYNFLALFEWIISYMQQEAYVNIITGVLIVISPTRKETSYSDQTLTFTSHSKKKIQKVVRPTRSPRQQ